MATTPSKITVRISWPEGAYVSAYVGTEFLRSILKMENASDGRPFKLDDVCAMSGCSTDLTFICSEPELLLSKKE